jgi:hypothetical protein
MKGPTSTGSFPNHAGIIKILTIRGTWVEAARCQHLPPAPSRFLSFLLVGAASQGEDGQRGRLHPRLDQQAGQERVGARSEAEAIKTFAKAEGYRLVGHFTEHESGKGTERSIAAPN